MAADFLAMLAEARNGQIAIDINEKFNRVLIAVRDTAGKGKLTVDFTIEPTKLGMGGVVVEVDVSHETKLKVPELKVGAAKFYVKANGELSRQDPALEDQEMMFQEEPKERKRGVQ